jgi:hypothetical protein
MNQINKITNYLGKMKAIVFPVQHPGSKQPGFLAKLHFILNLKPPDEKDGFHPRAVFGGGFS